MQRGLSVYLLSAVVVGCADAPPPLDAAGDAAAAVGVGDAIR